MVNKALVLVNRRGVIERKCKLVRQHQSGSSSRPHVGPPSAGPVFHPVQPQFQPRSYTTGQGFSTPQRQVIQHSNNPQTPTARNQNAQRAQVASDLLQTKRRCFACGEKGHFANRCSNSRPRINLPVAATLIPTHGANSVPVAAKQNYTCGRVNHVAVEEAQEASDIVIGMFLINGTSVVVLFDSRASYSFISTAYVGKKNLPLALLKCQMIVSSPGGDMPIRQLCPKLNLKIRGLDFVANLIVLKSKGIDIILGIDWLSKHKVLIDCAKKSIKLTTQKENKWSLS
jgi:hypothetical protein